MKIATKSLRPNLSNQERTKNIKINIKKADLTSHQLRMVTQDEKKRKKEWLEDDLQKDKGQQNFKIL